MTIAPPVVGHGDGAVGHGDGPDGHGGHNGHGGHGDGASGHLDRATKLRQFRQMTLMLIVSDVVFVACLFFAYLYLRALNVNNLWLPSSVHAPSMAAGWVIAGLMAASAVAYRWGDLGGRAGKHGRLLIGLAVALLVVVAELVVQIQQLAGTNFGPDAGAFPSCFYALGGYHAFHLGLLLLLGIGITIRAARGVYRRGEYNEAQLVGYVWYWVTVMAIVMALLPQ
jgi:heme/copper-type cytochrome/quinol oxidase subunit 3